MPKTLIEVLMLLGVAALLGLSGYLFAFDARAKWIAARGKGSSQKPEATPTPEIRLVMLLPTPAWEPTPAQEAAAERAADGVATRARMREEADREREAEAARRAATNEAALRAAAVGLVGERDERSAERKTWAMPAPAESQVRLRTRDTLPDEIEAAGAEARRGVA